MHNRMPAVQRDCWCMRESISHNYKVRHAAAPNCSFRATSEVELSKSHLSGLVVSVILSASLVLQPRTGTGERS